MCFLKTTKLNQKLLTLKKGSAHPHLQIPNSNKQGYMEMVLVMNLKLIHEKASCSEGDRSFFYTSVSMRMQYLACTGEVWKAL